VWTPTDSFSLGLDRYRIQRRKEFGVVDPAIAPDLLPEALVRDGDGILQRVNFFIDNIGRTEVRGWDLQASYLLRSTRAGDFAFRASAHHLEHHRRNTILDATIVDSAGQGLPSSTALASVRWRYRDHWTTTLT